VVDVEVVTVEGVVGMAGMAAAVDEALLCAIEVIADAADAVVGEALRPLATLWLVLVLFVNTALLAAQEEPYCVPGVVCALACALLLLLLDISTAIEDEPEESDVSILLALCAALLLCGMFSRGVVAYGYRSERESRRHTNDAVREQEHKRVSQRKVECDRHTTCAMNARASGASPCGESNACTLCAVTP
jgi:hypothetical protein